MTHWIKQAARIVAVAAVTATFFPATSYAQSGVPAYARPAADTIKGTIKGFDGAYKMYIRDSRGYIDDVTLHQGTVINPTGIRLQPGFPVTVEGHPSGSTFVADQIDTPFHSVGYYGYPYPAYGYPYSYAYPYPLVGGFYGRFGWGWRH